MNLMKEHPYILIGGLGAVVLLYALFKGAGGPAASQSAIDAANVNLSQIAAGVSTTQIQSNTALALSHDKTAASLETAAINLVGNENSNATAQNIKQIEANAAVQINHDTQEANLTTAPALAQIAATNSQALATISGQNAATIATIGANNRSSLAAARYGAYTNAALIRSAPAAAAGLGSLALGVASLGRGLFSGSGTYAGSGLGVGGGAGGGSTYLQTLNAENAANYGSLAGYAY